MDAAGVGSNAIIKESGGQGGGCQGGTCEPWEFFMVPGFFLLASAPKGERKVAYVKNKRKASRSLEDEWGEGFAGLYILLSLPLATVVR